MIKTNQLLARLSLLATALPSVVFAQVINRPSNDRPTGTSGGNNTVYIIVAVVVVAVVAFLFFRGKKKD